MTTNLHHESGDGLDYLDMSVVTDIHVARALRSLLTEWRMKKRWDTFTPESRKLHSDILRRYIATGKPPETSELETTLLEDMVNRDLVVLGTEGISVAYPFSTSETRHHVTIDGQEIFTVCAIDALGSGAMVGRAALVHSSCPVCDTPIEANLSGNGLTVASTSPDTTCLWAGIVAIEGCAATTQCQSMLLFCSQVHLHVWQEGHSRPPEGFILNTEQAVQAAAAIFRPFLDASKRATTW